MNRFLQISIAAALILLFATCKKDDDNPAEDDNFSEYFTCKINGVPFSGRSSFNCNGNSFYYYPAGAGGLDEAYMLISGTNCSEDRDVALRFFNPEVPVLGAIDFLSTLSADSISPIYYYYDSNGDGIAFDNTISGHVNIIEFSPRDSITLNFGKLEGTFEFTVTNEDQDSIVYVTDGAFRFKVPNFW